MGKLKNPLSQDELDGMIDAAQSMIDAETVDRFDLEEQMIASWGIIDDLNLIYENILGDVNMTKNDIVDLLVGISKLYEIKFQKQSDTFNELLQHGSIR